MRIGLAVKNFTWPGAPESIGPIMGRIAEQADAAGLASLWVMDHFFQVPLFGTPEQEMLESYTTLAYAAGRTRRIELGALVTGVSYRHPGILIKMVTTLDVLSGGRAWLGIGAAWNEQEHRGLGVPFPPLRERFERLEETLIIAHRMWAGDDRPIHGKHYQLEWPHNSPPAIRRPHPPILIGGGGEQKTLRLVAKYADACNLFDAYGLDVLRHKLEVLREHCAAEGRPYEEIEKTVYMQLALSRDGGGVTETPAQAVERIHRLAEEGIDHVIVSLQNVWRQEEFDLLAAEVVPAVAEMVPAGRSVAVGSHAGLDQPSSGRSYRPDVDRW